MRDKRFLDYEHEVEAQLDAALKTYAGASPREGLEARILAWTEERVHAPRPGFSWRLALSAVTLIVLAAVMLPFGLHRDARPALRDTAVVKKSALPRALAPPKVELMRASARPGHRRRPHARVAASQPFVQMPLSAQERLLLQLAASPQRPLANLHDSAPIEILPIEISAIQIKPLSQGAANN